MTIVRVGTTKKYADGWEAAFGKGSKKSAPAARSTKTKAKKAAPKKKARTSAKKRAKAGKK